LSAFQCVNFHYYGLDSLYQKEISGVYPTVKGVYLPSVLALTVNYCNNGADSDYISESRSTLRFSQKGTGLLQRMYEMNKNKEVTALDRPVLVCRDKEDHPRYKNLKYLCNGKTIKVAEGVFLKNLTKEAKANYGIE
jgi:hypothetical protein